jgi:hypothetical protein
LPKRQRKRPAWEDFSFRVGSSSFARLAVFRATTGIKAPGVPL